MSGISRLAQRFRRCERSSIHKQLMHTQVARYNQDWGTELASVQARLKKCRRQLATAVTTRDFVTALLAYEHRGRCYLERLLHHYAAKHSSLRLKLSCLRWQIHSTRSALIQLIEPTPSPTAHSNSPFPPIENAEEPHVEDTESNLPRSFILCQGFHGCQTLSAGHSRELERVLPIVPREPPDDRQRLLQLATVSRIKVPKVLVQDNAASDICLPDPIDPPVREVLSCYGALSIPAPYACSWFPSKMTHSTAASGYDRRARDLSRFPQGKVSLTHLTNIAKDGAKKASSSLAAIGSGTIDALLSIQHPQRVPILRYRRETDWSLSFWLAMR
jgi:hypothetical protein